MKAPQQVIAMLQDCHNEAEASGFEVAQSAHSIGSPPDWYVNEEYPKLEWVHGRIMIFTMPNGDCVQVEAHMVRK